MKIKANASGPGSAGFQFAGKHFRRCEGENDGGGSGGAKPKGGEAGAATFNQGQIDQINGIVRAVVQRVDFGPMIAPAIAESMKAAMPDLLKSITAEVTKVLPAPGAGGASGGKSGGAKGDEGALSAELQDRFAKLEAKIQQQDSDLKAKDDAIKASTQRERDQQLGSKMRAALEAKKVRPETIDAVMALHEKKTAGSVKWGDEGPTIKVKRSQYGNTFTEEIPVETYVDEWVKSDEGKAYLPAPGGRGSGMRMGGGAGGGGGAGTGGRPNGQPALSDQDLGAQLMQAYLNQADE